MSLPVPGLNSAVSAGQIGLAAGAATAKTGSKRTSATANVQVSPDEVANRVCQLIIHLSLEADR